MFAVAAMRQCQGPYRASRCTLNTSARSALRLKMVSKLEDTLLRCSKGNGRIRAALFKYQDGHDLRRLRIASRTLHDLTDHFPQRLFSHLFARLPRAGSRGLAALRTVLPFCHDLVIIFGSPPVAKVIKLKWKWQSGKPPENNLAQNESEARTSAKQRWKNIRKVLATGPLSSDFTERFLQSQKAPESSTRSSRSSFPQQASESTASAASQASSQQLWTDLLALPKELRSLTLRVHSDKAWPGRTAIEASLVDLRMAIDSVAPPHLKNVRIMPIHALGILHLRWSTFGAFGSTPTQPTLFWHGLHTLDLQIQNPFVIHQKLSEAQQGMFRKILHDYLRSFANTLKCLRFVWLDAEGPSPVTLDLEPSLAGARDPVLWRALESIWLGNVTLPHRTIMLLPERTVKSVQLKMLRSTHRHSRALFEDADAWVEVLLGEKMVESGGRERAASGGSSVYSQEI